MGGTQSVNGSPEFHTVKKPESYPEATNKVELIGDVGDQKEIFIWAYDLDFLEKKAYEKGKEDGEKVTAAIFNEIACQTFTDVNEQLSQIQAKALAGSLKMVSELKSTIATSNMIPARKTMCATEESALKACLDAKSLSPLSCSVYITSLSKCASSQ